MRYALVGNQNCGKTTLFNQLTGSNQHVGNFPGVTVDSKMGDIRGERGNSVVDLPGIYSIRPYTNEELVTRRFILKERPEGIINIVDATNIERNLYLTLQLLEMHIPMVLALNMMDEVRNNGGTIDIGKMEELLGIPVVAISAAKNEGIEDLIHAIKEVSERRIYPKVMDFCEKGAVHRCIHAVSHQVEDHAEKIGISPRFAATKIVEGDHDIIKSLHLSDNELDLMEHSIVEMEKDSEMDRNAALADMRYAFIERVCSQAVIKCHESKEHRRSVRIDSVLTNKYLALPSFLMIMLLVFWLTFGVIGAFLSDLLSRGIDSLSAVVERALVWYGINPVVESLVIDGIFTGVGSVLSFLPIIVVLFFFLSILEDSGYMARIAFVMDRPLRRIGLSGKSFVSMLIGFGCSVPAVMSTRTLSSERDKKMTIMLIPFISCSAKIPIYALFAAAFFEERQALVMMGLYVLIWRLAGSDGADQRFYREGGGGQHFRSVDGHQYECAGRRLGHDLYAPCGCQLSGLHLIVYALCRRCGDDQARTWFYMEDDRYCPDAVRGGLDRGILSLSGRESVVTGTLSQTKFLIPLTIGLYKFDKIT